MRVKVGNEWFEATEEHPIAVELTDRDKDNIAHMSHDTCVYAIFVSPPKNEIERGGRIAWSLKGSHKAMVLKSTEEAEQSVKTEGAT